MITYGIDPDSERHGVAVYQGKKLVHLDTLPLLDLLEVARVEQASGSPVRFSIEDVCSQNFIYQRNAKDTKSAHAKVALSIGRCQQAQIELMRGLDKYKIPYQLHKPQKGNWADKKREFELVTGWKKRSNSDTRSAAYFGFLAVS